MKRLLISFVAIFTLSSAMWADLTTYDKAVHLGNEVHIKPVALASGTTSIVSQDVYLTDLFIIVANTVTAVTVLDKQGSPIPLFPAITTAAGTVYYLPANIRYWCPGGFSVITNGTGAYIYASWEQKGTPMVTQ